MIEILREEINKNLKIMEYLLNLAFIDKEFSPTERMIVEDISNALKIKSHDFENLINTFEAFYLNQASSNALSLDKAYEVLESNSSDDDMTIKKNYRKLVKQYHPDIMSGRGESQSIIDEATKKLQEINEAYELIKKDRGN